MSEEQVRKLRIGKVLGQVTSGATRDKSTMTDSSAEIVIKDNDVSSQISEIEDT